MIGREKNLLHVASLIRGVNNVILMCSCTLSTFYEHGWTCSDLNSVNSDFTEEGIKSPILSNLHITSLSQNRPERTTVAL